MGKQEIVMNKRLVTMCRQNIIYNV